MLWGRGFKGLCYFRGRQCQWINMPEGIQKFPLSIVEDDRDMKGEP